MKKFFFLLFLAALICSGANLPEKLPSAADSERLLKLGQDHQFGSNGHPRDFTKAAAYYRQAYEQGNATAAWHLAMLYYSGSGVEKNLAKAFELTSFAAKNGCAWANVSLAGMYINGIGCTKDPAAGFACYLKAAQAGIPGGYGGAGWCLIFGIGTEIDIPRGVEYYRKAADKFDPVAMYTLAGWYYYGQFVQQDKKKADLFYRLLRRQWSSIYYANNAGILFQRGIMCRFGQGGKERNGEVELHIPVDHQHFLARHSQRTTHVGTRSGFSAAAFVIRKCNYDCLAHMYSLLLVVFLYSRLSSRRRFHSCLFRAFCFLFSLRFFCFFRLFRFRSQTRRALFIVL